MDGIEVIDQEGDNDGRHEKSCETEESVLVLGRHPLRKKGWRKSLSRRREVIVGRA